MSDLSVQAGLAHLSEIEFAAKVDASSGASTFAARFWKKVSPDSAGCWLWSGAKTTTGYGLCLVGTGARANRRTIVAHRMAYELIVGPIPRGLLVCHACDVRHCVRHLFLGTHQENIDDMVRKGRKGWNGLKRPYAKLTWQDIEQIRRLAPAMRQYQIARRFGVSQSTISLVVTGKTWQKDVS